MISPDFYENSYYVVSSNHLSSLPSSTQSLASSSQSSSVTTSYSVSNNVLSSALLPSSAQSTSETTSYSESNISPQFEFPSSEQFANNIVYYVIRLAQQTMSNHLHLIVLENMVTPAFQTATHRPYQLAPCRKSSSKLFNLRFNHSKLAFISWHHLIMNNIFLLSLIILIVVFLLLISIEE